MRLHFWAIFAWRCDFFVVENQSWQLQLFSLGCLAGCFCLFENSPACRMHLYKGFCAKTSWVNPSVLRPFHAVARTALLFAASLNGRYSAMVSTQSHSADQNVNTTASQGESGLWPWYALLSECRSSLVPRFWAVPGVSMTCLCRVLRSFSAIAIPGRNCCVRLNTDNKLHRWVPSLCSVVNFCPFLRITQ